MVAQQVPGGRSPPLSGRLVRLALKELRETLRDRRTILTLVLMPVMLYPLLSVGFQRFLLTQRQVGTYVHRIGIEGDDEDPRNRVIRELLTLGDAVLQREMAREGTLEDTTADMALVTDFEEALRHGDIDVGVRVTRIEIPNSPGGNERYELELISLEGSRSGAREFVRDRFQAAGRGRLIERLAALGVQQRGSPVRIRSVLVKSDRIAGVNLASMIPIVLVLMTITGAVYPAIDLTAGERERNTLELLVAAPIPRLGLLLAKYVAVVTVAFLTATLNLVSMIATLQATGMGSLVWGDGGISYVTIGLVLLLLSLFAGFFSAVLLCITSFARSFKEAQAYLVPVMLMSISPGLVSLLPDISLRGPLAVVPLLNVTLLARDLLAGRADPAAAMIVVGTTVLYGGAALGLASRIFGADAVLYDARAGWGDLIERPAKVIPAPPLGTALGCLAILFPASFLAAGFVGQQAAWTIDKRLLANSLLAGFLFFVIPTCLALWQRVSFGSGFHLRVPSLLSLLGAIILGASLWPLVHELVVLMMRSGLVTLLPEHLERGKKVVAELQRAPLGLVLLGLAIVPGITEEWLFRGYVFSALRQRFAAWPAVVTCGLLFGLFHLVATDSLAVERLLPSMALGCVLAWVCWQSDSLIPGTALHVLHNGLNLVLSRFGEDWAKSGWIPSEFLSKQDIPSHLPSTWLAGAAAFTALGAGLVWLGRKQTPEALPTASSR